MFLFRGSVTFSFYLAVVGVLISGALIQGIKWIRIISILICATLCFSIALQTESLIGWLVIAVGLTLGGYLLGEIMSLVVNEINKPASEKVQQRENRKSNTKYTDKELLGKKVFISYRRSTSKFVARAIFEDLRHKGFDVFMDVESINSGEFEKIIMNQISARPHFLIILAEGSLVRCSNPNDLMRREIEHAISEKRNIIPILVEGFKFSENSQHLGNKINQLNNFNSLALSHDYFVEAMQRLESRFLNRSISAPLQVTSDKEQKIIMKKVRDIVSSPKPTHSELIKEMRSTK